MKRIFTSMADPAEGGVYRDLGGCGVLEYGSSSSGSSGMEEVFPLCGTCIDTEVVSIISPPGCATFLTTDNEYGRLPTTYVGDVQIDPYGYDDRFESLAAPFPPADPTCPTPPSILGYPDLWTRAGAISTALQSDILQDTCYCLGDGVDRNVLAIGRPQFPRVTPLPFFAFPEATTTSINVREFNPDGPPLVGDCCPASDDTGDHIVAELVDNELRLTRNKKFTDFPELYRVDDTHHSFQVVAGYPQQCCMRDPCAPSAVGGEGVDDFVLRDLHFPRWPGPNSVTSNVDADEGNSIREARDPYEPVEADREEPLGVIPVVVDIQCHTDGKLYVYYANIVVHDGHVAGLQWHVSPPRPDTLSWAGNEAPSPPENLDVNLDYQDREIFDPFEPLTDQSELQPWCENTCLSAATQMDKAAEACIPACPAESVYCNEGESQIISLGFGASSQEAIDAAFVEADDDTPVGCDLAALYTLCYVKWNAGTSSYEAAVTFCCDD
jgi:hypothetical protein